MHSKPYIILRQSTQNQNTFPIYVLIFRGTSGLDIDLQKVDIDQCPNELRGGIQRVCKLGQMQELEIIIFFTFYINFIY